MTTSVKMKLSDFANTPFGLFSLLKCGDKRLYVLEQNQHDDMLNDGCILAGIYDVVRIENDSDFDQWLVCNVPERVDIEITTGTEHIDTRGNLLLGQSLSCFEGVWSLKDTDRAFDIFNHWLDDVDSFRLYIERRTILFEYN